MKTYYRDLLKQGWKLKDIDEMDIMYFFELMAAETKSKKVYIDQIL